MTIAVLRQRKSTFDFEKLSPIIMSIWPTSDELLINETLKLDTVEGHTGTVY